MNSSSANSNGGGSAELNDTQCTSDGVQSPARAADANDSDDAPLQHECPAVDGDGARVQSARAPATDRRANGRRNRQRPADRTANVDIDVSRTVHVSNIASSATRDQLRRSMGPAGVQRVQFINRRHALVVFSRPHMADNMVKIQGDAGRRKRLWLNGALLQVRKATGRDVDAWKWATSVRSPRGEAERTGGGSGYASGWRPTQRAGTPPHQYAQEALRPEQYMPSLTFSSHMVPPAGGRHVQLAGCDTAATEAKAKDSGGERQHYSHLRLVSWRVESYDDGNGRLLAQCDAYGNPPLYEHELIDALASLSRDHCAGRLHVYDWRVDRLLARATPPVQHAYLLWRVGGLRQWRSALHMAGPFVGPPAHAAVRGFGDTAANRPIKESWEPMHPYNIRTFDHLALYMSSLLRHFGPQCAHSSVMQMLQRALRSSLRQCPYEAVTHAMQRRIDNLVVVDHTFYLLDVPMHRDLLLAKLGNYYNFT